MNATPASLPLITVFIGGMALCLNLGLDGEELHEPLRGSPVPQRRYLVRLSLGLPDGGGDGGDGLGVEPEQRVGALADRDRPLGVVAQGEAGDAEVGRFLLDAP